MVLPDGEPQAPDRPIAASTGARTPEVETMLDNPTLIPVHGSPVDRSSPKLLAAAPIIAVSQDLERHVADLRRLAPTSDATTALSLYQDKLKVAIQRACQLDLFISAEQAAVILGRSVSMITYLCRNGALRAKKVGGVWQIDRLDLERMRRDEESGENREGVHTHRG
jgi:hypothetical protein